MGLFDSLPIRGNGQDIEAGWFNAIRSALNNVFDALTLNDISDVNITSPTNSQVLAYNSISGKWENSAGGGGGGGLGQLENIAFIGKGKASWTFTPPVGDVTVQSYNVDSGDINLSTNIPKGFTFTPSNTGELKLIRMGIVNRGLGNGNGTFQIKIYATSGGLPTGAALDSSSTPGTGAIGVNNVVYNNFTFAGNITLNAGTKYAALIVSTDTGTVAVRRGSANQSFSENVEETGVLTGVYQQMAEQRTFRHEVVFDNLASGGSLVLDSVSYVSVPPLLDNRHKINAQTINMENDQVAYITVNRSQTIESFAPVTVVQANALTPDGNKLIIARCNNGDCHIGINDPQRLGDGEVIDLQQGKGLLRPKGSTGSPIIVDETIGIVIGKEMRQVIYVRSSAGQKTVTANPQVSAGTRIGQELILVGTSDTNYLTLNDGTGLALNGPLNLKNNQASQFFWNGTVWQEVSRR